MRDIWIVPGSEENWRQAFISKGIWGLKERTLDRVYKKMPEYPTACCGVIHFL